VCLWVTNVEQTLLLSYRFPTTSPPPHYHVPFSVSFLFV
jgi:hypothetical protein